ncbi:MAG TPA: hypothetical protein VIN35_05730, partial [Hydrogenophaga sp.]
MNRCLTTLALGLTLIGASSSALAEVKYLDVRNADGIHVNDGRVIVRPVNGKHTEIVTPELVYHLEMKAGCSKDFAKAHFLMDTRVTFGNAYANGNSRAPNAPHTEVPSSGKKEIDWTEAVLKVPVASAKGDLDPAAICQAWVNQRLGQGATLQQVLAQDKTISKAVTLSGVAQCGRWTNPEKAEWKTKTLAHQLTVVCKAGSAGGVDDVKLKDPPPLSPANSFNKHLEVVASRLKALSPNMVGQCPASMPFQAEIQADAAGEVDYEINFPSNAGTPAQKRQGKLVFEGPGTKKTPIVEFTAVSGYPVGVASLVIEQPGQNKAYDHFKVQCVQAPVAGGAVFSQPQGSPPPMTRPVKTMVPPPPPPRAIQAPPVAPSKPPRSLQSAPVTPPPAPSRGVQAPPVEPPKPPRAQQVDSVAPPPPPPAPPR